MLWWPELGFFALLLALCVSLLAALRGLVLARRLPAWHPRCWAWAQGGVGTGRLSAAVTGPTGG
ncbi:Uncharacterised protein [Edwardsiella tarda]|nr:Uncharacterised protein [Edwardsiella tarda]